MLSCLRIHQLAVIDELEVLFGPGLNVVTGETGAGKSILITALGLVLGERSRSDLVRTGAEAAEVEALFTIGDDAVMREVLRNLDVEEDEELVLRRRITANGRSRAYINGRLATAAQLSKVADGLVDICSQHEHHTLGDPAVQLDLLDGFAGLLDTREAMATAFAAQHLALQQLQTSRSKLQQRAERQDFLRFQLAEFEQLAPQVGEDEALEEEQNRLQHAGRLVDGASQLESELYTRDGALTEQLGRLENELEQLAQLDPGLAPLARRLQEARVEVEDIGAELGDYAGKLVSDPSRLAEIDTRLEALGRLARRHGGELGHAIARASALALELSTLDDLDSAVSEHEAAFAQAAAAALTIADELTRRREQHADALGEAVSTELTALRMGDARVVVEVDGDARLSPTGRNRVEFLIAPNRGEPPKPLGKIASGGELSRALLALKRVLAGLGRKGLYVFDEVDAGVGGATADVIGKKLDDIARHHQVLCITHLPQIAAYADQHFRVEKSVVEGRTRSTVQPLAHPQRVDELARMLGGAAVTPAAQQAAAALLEGAAA